jgi:WhiB family transcriptional regulator, redox-sensing transcriptional regulator
MAEHTTARPRLDWLAAATCRGPEHSQAFYPPPRFERKHDRLVRERRAKAICADCRVRQECLDFALATREPHGIWGGLTEVERAALVVERPATESA